MERKIFLDDDKDVYIDNIGKCIVKKIIEFKVIVTEAQTLSWLQSAFP